MGTSDADRAALLARLFGEEAVPKSLSDELLRTRDVARAFQVSERTVAEWARRGRIPSVRTPGGHRLYPADKIRDLLRAAESGNAPGEPLATTS
jgi:excisionase family DNA binding protein